MAAGLGTGLFTFDENGCPVNPLDFNDERAGCNGIAPATVYDPANIALDLDRIVEASGASNASNNHTWIDAAIGPSLRDVALDPQLAGPLGATLIQRLTDPAGGIVLDSWIDADGTLEGDAALHVRTP
jgi:hypothetical protein